jgi:branched-chain amino acid aminotransferase
MRVTWFNGALIEGPIAVDPQDRGLLLGDGIFETILVLNGQPQWLQQHLSRMAISAAKLGIPFSRDDVMEGISSVLGTCDLAPKSLRVTLTRGKALGGFSVDGDAPSLLVTVDRFDPALMHEPLTFMTSSVRRNEHSPSSRMKTLSYVDGIMAAREAKGRADDALMLNVAGRVACGTIGNVFAVKGRLLLTPAINEGVLPGIIRARLLECAAGLGYDGQEAKLTLDDLHGADAVFLTNSLRLIRPVKQLDGLRLGNGGADAFIEAMKPHVIEGAET